MGCGYLTVDIEKVLELGGAIRPDFDCLSSVYAHIYIPNIRTTSEILDGSVKQYALLAINPQHGIMNLGNINPEMRRFEHYDEKMRDSALYEMDDRYVVNRIHIPSNQIDKIKTLEEVLGIQEIYTIRKVT